VRGRQGLAGAYFELRTLLTTGFEDGPNGAQMSEHIPNYRNLMTSYSARGQ
jgi:hypothetical protein